MTDSMRYRVVPFKTNSGEQMFTLVQEWLTKGEVVLDSRQQMDLETFEQLKHQCNLAFQIKDLVK